MRYVIGAGSSGGGKGGGGSSARTAVEDPDSLQSHQYAKIVDLLSEGPIGGLVNGLQSVYLNDTPVQSANGAMNFSGISLAYRNGYNDQTVIEGFTDVENEREVNVEIENHNDGNNFVVAHVPTGVDAVRVTVGIPALSKQDTKNGDLHGSSVGIGITVNNNGNGDQAAHLRYEWAPFAAGPSSATCSGYGIGMTVSFSFPSQQVWVYDPQQYYSSSNTWTSNNYDDGYGYNSPTDADANGFTAQGDNGDGDGGVTSGGTGGDGDGGD